MIIEQMLERAHASVGQYVRTRKSITLQDSHDVAGVLELAAELTSGGATVAITASSGVLDDGARVPVGLALTIGGDSYSATAEAVVEDAALSIAIAPAATTTYAASSAVVLADAVTWDLAALDAIDRASTESREPGSRRNGTDHSASTYVLKSKLPGMTAARLREMELTINGRSTVVLDAVDEDPFWAILAGGPR